MNVALGQSDTMKLFFCCYFLIPDEKWQEKMYVMGDDPNSTESTEDTKRKIEELQNVSKLQIQTLFI